MPRRRELPAFALLLAALVAFFLRESLLGGKVLSPADVVFVQASFREAGAPDYEPANRLLMDPVLQFEPWLEFSRNGSDEGHAGCVNELAHLLKADLNLAARDDSGHRLTRWRATHLA